ncbi:hypothetical protein S245_028385, partial [Arachis hypogaea]
NTPKLAPVVSQFLRSLLFLPEFVGDSLESSLCSMRLLSISSLPSPPRPSMLAAVLVLPSRQFRKLFIALLSLILSRSRIRKVYYIFLLFMKSLLIIEPKNVLTK